MTLPLIVDCDTGVDDALALLYLAADPDVEIVAAGSVHGNVPAPLAAENTLRVLEVAGIAGVPAAVGAHRPLAQPLGTEEGVHGHDGLGNTNPPPPRERPVAGSAAEQIVRLARERPGELQLLATGPLTNVALALLLEPELPRLVPRVVVMGGAVQAPGNSTALAEANIWHDPEAAALVFTAPWHVTMIGLDVTMRALLGGEDLARLERAASPAARFAAAIVRHYLDVYERHHGARACALHDPLAAAVVSDPSLCTYSALSIDVELRGTQSRGATIADRRDHARIADQDGGRPLVDVALEVDSERFLARFLERLGA